MRAVLVAAVMILGSASARAQEAATPPATTPAEEDASATLTALRTQPQVPTVRGGSLGIPAAFGSEGLQAMVSTQAVHTGEASPALPDKIDFDFFTRLGGLQLFDSFSVDILAELYKQSLPHVDLDARPVLPRMQLGELRDVGFRARWTTARDAKVSVIQEHAREATQEGSSAKDSVVGQFLRHNELTLTTGARFLQRSDPAHDTLDFSGASAELIAQYSRARSDINPGCADKQAKKLAPALDKAQSSAADLITRNKKRTAVTTADEGSLAQVDAHLKSARASLPALPLTGDTAIVDHLKLTSENLDQLAAGISNPPGASGSQPAAELDASREVLQQVDATKQRVREALTTAENAATACRTGGYGLTTFLGLSGTLLHTAAIHDDMQNIENPLFKELRLTIGGDLQSSYTGPGTTLLPRIGFYATLSRGTWQNRFAAPGMVNDVDGFQFEGAIYVSGHVISGFDVLVSFVALKPYGHGSTEFLINVAPAIGAVLGSR